MRLSKSKYYLELFNEVKDYKSYWRLQLVRNATNGKSIAPILGIRNGDGKVVTSDRGVPRIFQGGGHTASK